MGLFESRLYPLIKILIYVKSCFYRTGLFQDVFERLLEKSVDFLDSVLVEMLLSIDAFLGRFLIQFLR